MAFGEDGYTAAPLSAGRGRGRGGGVPVLPQGMWDSLVAPTSLGATPPTETESTTYAVASAVESNKDVGDIGYASTSSLRPPAEANAERVHGQSQQAQDQHQFDDSIPMSFGRGGGSGPGRWDSGRGRGGGSRGTEPSGGRGWGRGRDSDKSNWICPSCQNTNWSWRTNCNMCACPKPSSMLSENEVRDGVGGGFNERQDRVAGLAVEVAEDGFDDFGRRAKARASDKAAKEAAALARLHQSYGFLLDPAATASGTAIPTITGHSTVSASVAGLPKGNNSGGGSGGQFSDAADARGSLSSHSSTPMKGGESGGGKSVNSKESDQNRLRDGQRDRDRSRDRYSRGSSRDRDRYSSSTRGGGGGDRDRRERSRDRDRDRRDRSRDRDRDRRDRSRSRERDRRR